MTRKAINLISILRDSSKLSASAGIGFALSLTINLMIGRFLSPEEVGIFAVVTMWTFYSQLIRPGLLSAAGRDVPHLLGAGEAAEARHIQNIALTGELLFSVIPLAVVCGAGLFYKGTVIRGAFLVAAATMIISSVQATLGSMFYVYRRFDIAARLRMIVAVVAPAGILLSIRTLGIFSLLAMPGVAAACALVIVWRHRDVLGFRFTWDWKVAAYMVRVGAPFALMTIVSWGYFMSDRPALIAAGLPLAVIGYYSFATNLIRSVAQVFWDFTAVLQPMFWHEIGRQGSVAAVASDVAGVWIPYTAVACFAASIGQAAFGAVVHWIAPRFEPSVPVFEILVFILVFYNATQLPNLVLNSRMVNRQQVTLYLWTAGLILNTGALYFYARSGASITRIAALSMGVDALIAMAGFAVSHKHLFSSRQAGFWFYSWQALLMTVSVLLYLAFQTEHLRYTAGSQWQPLVGRGVAALVVWGGVAAAMWFWWPAAAPESPQPDELLHRGTHVLE